MNNSNIDESEIQIFDTPTEDSEMFENLRRKPIVKLVLTGIANDSELATFLEDSNLWIIDPKRKELITGDIYDGCGSYCKVRIVKGEEAAFIFYDEHSHEKIGFALSDYFRKKRQK